MPAHVKKPSGVQWSQYAPAVIAAVGSTSGLDPVVACGRHAVLSAGAFIWVPALLSNRHAAQVTAVGSLGVGSQSHHQFTPLRAMGLDPPVTKALVNRVVSHLVGHGVGKMQPHILGKDPGVES